MEQGIVAGIDSSTQSCKVVVREAEGGKLRRFGQASHPRGTEVNPEAWIDALHSAVSAAGGLADVDCLAVAGQQHGMVLLDERGRVIRPALLWNDTRSAKSAVDLIDELGVETGDGGEGAAAWAVATGSVPVASLTISKLRWIADNEPESAGRIRAIALPHDWIMWKLRGETSLDTLVTDRSEASGTGYFDAVRGEYRRDLLAMALRRDDVDEIVLPRVASPSEEVGRTSREFGRALLGPGAGDNAAAAFALGLQPTDVAVSVGTSGVVSAVMTDPAYDKSGAVTVFADATGRYLPMAVTLNASRILDITAELLHVDHEGLSELALSASAGADDLTLIPFFDGERTPDLPHATGSLLGLTTASLTRENLARAAVEGVLCGLAEALAAVQRLGLPTGRVFLLGGGARSLALRRLAPAFLGGTVQVPEQAEYVADGAAKQAAWVLSGSEVPPVWPKRIVEVHESDIAEEVLERYRERNRMFTPRASITD